MKNLPLENLLGHLLYESHQPELLLQFAVLLACGVLSWAISKLVASWLPRLHLEFHSGKRRVKAIGLPLLWLLFTDLARGALKGQHEVHLLNIAIPLLGATILLRLGILVLRHFTGDRPAARHWERILSWVIWIGFALHITGLLPELASLLDSIAFNAGDHRFSLLLLLEAIFVLTFAIMFALWLSQLAESGIMQAEGLDPSLRLALAKSLRTLLLILAVMVALPAVGIDITILSVFGGALGVGLGLGLQKIASNYVSGFMILLDRSVRPGDMITVDNHYGEVRQLKTRYTVLRAFDGTEIILPNETLLTSTVINHSFTQPEVTVQIPVQISYESDLELAMRLMTEAGKAHPRVIRDDKFPVQSFITEFADNGINLTLLVWIADPELGTLGLKSDIYLTLYRQFNANHIGLPYPHRDVRVYNMNMTDS